MKYVKRTRPRANRCAAPRAQIGPPGKAKRHDFGARVIPRRAERNPAPLSFAQQRLWAIHRRDPESFADNEALAIRLQGLLNVAALGRALDAIVERHEVLRTTYAAPEGGDPVQLVGDFRPVNIPIIDLAEYDEPERENELQHLIAAKQSQPFDLSRDLLLRAILARRSSIEHVLILVTHHIAADRQSSQLLWREAAVLYEAFSRGKPNPLPELPIQYSDYAAWQRRCLQGVALENHLTFWKQQLSEVPALELLTNRRRAAFQSGRVARQSLILPRILSDQIKALSKRQGTTLFVTLLAAFKVLIYRYTGQEDVVVGSPITGRIHPETEAMIGCFGDTLMLRSDLSGNPTFRELLTRVQKSCSAAYEHQELSVEWLFEKINANRDPTPLFQVGFKLEDSPIQGPEIAGLSTQSIKIDRLASKVDLYAAFIDSETQLVLRLEYRSALFDDGTMARMLNHFQTVLESAIAKPFRRIAKLPLLSATESRQILVDWNDTHKDYREERCVHQLFESQVERSPSAVAVINPSMGSERGRDNQLTYSEINTRANQLAHYLRKLGVKRDILVGLYLERSPEMIIAVLAVHKAGGAYVPLDPNYPLQRLLVISDETKFPVILSQQRLAETFPNHVAKVICLDTDWATIAQGSQESPGVRSAPENLAYVIYTSGSTGLPKGIEVTHRSLTNFALWASATYELAPRDRVLQFASISFDTAAEEIFPCLASGAALVLRDSALDSLSGFLPRLRDLEITVLDLPTFHWHEWVEELASGPRPELASLRLVIIGGEQASAVRLRKWREVVGAQVRLVNTYGPTETTVVSTLWESSETSRQPENNRSVPIGRPIANTQVYILDANLQPVPIGVRGEIHIGGVGLARGYLKRPALTLKKFIVNPFCRDPGARLYETGDFARYLADGNIEYLGRMDTQLKMRGIRIELGEIEAVLRQHGSVREPIVLAREDVAGYPHLVAYVVPKPGSAPTASELRGFLSATLPDYLVPSGFVLLDALPLTPNGKVDQRALAAINRSELKDGFVPPRTPVEKIMASIWTDILKLKQIGIYDNFFDIGSHSFLAIEVVSRVRKVFAMDLPLRELFAAPTVAGMAATVVKARSKRDNQQDLRVSLANLESLPSEQRPRLLTEH